MKALVGDVVVAEAALHEIVRIEGNVYFPPGSIVEATLRDSSRPYTCPWKGVAQYHDVVLDDTVLSDAAWSYPRISQFARERVGRDFGGYVAFDPRRVRLER